MLYFKHFRSRNCLVDIVPMTSKYTAAEHLVKNAKGLLSHADYFQKMETNFGVSSIVIAGRSFLPVGMEKGQSIFSAALWVLC